jgi:hypothetical protein
MEDPLPLKIVCSNTFWEEDSGVVPTSGLFHFTIDIDGTHASIVIDTCSSANLVSVEVVEKLQLCTFGKVSPYLLASTDHSLPVTRTTHVPLNIYGHTKYVHCDVVPRAFNVCHISLGKQWCDRFEVIFGSDYPDPLIFWNGKHTWLASTCIKQF